MKNQKGITLVALVVTIVVLLILAGVSIAMITGSNGLFTKSSEAGVKTEAAEVKENVELAISTVLTVAIKNDPVATSWTLSIDDIVSEIKDTNAITDSDTITGTGDLITYKTKNNTFKVTLAADHLSISTLYLGDDNTTNYMDILGK